MLIFSELWVSLRDMLGVGCFINIIDLPCPAVPRHRKITLACAYIHIVIFLVVVASYFIIYPSGAFTIV